MVNPRSRVASFAAPMWRSSARSFLAPPARIAIAGDWHTDTDYGVAAIGHAAKRDATVLLHLGDFGYNFTDTYLAALDDALRRHGLVLGFVDGNHENFDRLLTQPIAADGLRHLRDRVVHLPRGFRWRWGQTRCVAVGGAYSIDRFLRIPGRSWWPQETITAQQACYIAAGGRADVMFCHDCPAGIEVPGAAFDRFFCPPMNCNAARNIEHCCAASSTRFGPPGSGTGTFTTATARCCTATGIGPSSTGWAKTVTPSTTTWWSSIWRTWDFIDSARPCPINDRVRLDQPEFSLLNLHRRWSPPEIDLRTAPRLMAPANEGAAGDVCPFAPSTGV